MNNIELKLSYKSNEWEYEQYSLLCINGEVDCIIDNTRTIIKKNTLFRKTKITTIKIKNISNNAIFIQCVPLKGFNNYLQLVLPLLSTLRTYNTVLTKLSDNAVSNFIHEAQALHNLKIEIHSTIKNSCIEKVLTQKYHSLYLYIWLDTINLLNKTDLTPIKAPLLSSFIELICNNCQTQRKTEFYAKLMRLSTSHFSLRIKEETGKYPVYWINKLTIEKIQKDIQEDILTPKEIAEKYKFSEVQALRIFFKRHTNYTINEYRNEI